MKSVFFLCAGSLLLAGCGSKANEASDLADEAYAEGSRANGRVEELESEVETLRSEVQSLEGRINDLEASLADNEDADMKNFRSLNSALGVVESAQHRHY